MHGFLVDVWEGSPRHPESYWWRLEGLGFAGGPPSPQVSQIAESLVAGPSKRGCLSIRGVEEVKPCVVEGVPARPEVTGHPGVS